MRAITGASSFYCVVVASLLLYVKVVIIENMFDCGNLCRLNVSRTISRNVISFFVVAIYTTEFITPQPFMV